MKQRAGGAVLQQRGAVEQGAAPVAGIGGRHSRQQRRGVLQIGRKAAEHCDGAAHKPAAHQEIAGKVSHQGQLGGDYEIGPLGAGGANAADNQRGVSVKIARRGIDLEQRDTQDESSVTTIRRRLLTYLSHYAYNTVVKEDTVRTSLDVPIGLHRRLHAAAARKGCSARQLILRGIERALRDAEPQRPRRRLSLAAPIVASTGKPFDLANEQIYDLIEFP